MYIRAHGSSKISYGRLLFLIFIHILLNHLVACIMVFIARWEYKRVPGRLDFVSFKMSQLIIFSIKSMIKEAFETFHYMSSL